MTLCCSGLTGLERKKPACNCPSKCFCKFEPEELVEVAIRKFEFGESTVSLMKQAKTSHQRDIVCIVSMLDVEDRMADYLVPGRMDNPTCDVLNCRETLRKNLAECIRYSDIKEKEVTFSLKDMRDQILACV